MSYSILHCTIPVRVILVQLRPLYDHGISAHVSLTVRNTRVNDMRMKIESMVYSNVQNKVK